MSSIDHSSPKNKPDLSKINLLTLVGAASDLKPVATTNGGEYAGPCPFCGGEDRFRVWPTPTEGNPRYWCRKCDRKGDAIDYVRERDQLDFPGALAKLGLGNTTIRKNDSRSRPGKIIAEYIYTDQQGSPQFRVTRHEPKDFRQWRLEDGKWTAGLKGQIPPLYNLPNVLDAVRMGDLVWLVEGEKSAEALMQRALTATCNAMGAGKWYPHWTKDLEGGTIGIIPDNDDAGLKHAREVAREIAGYAREVRIVNLPGLAYHETHGEDVYDWLERGGTVADLHMLFRDARIVRSLRRRIELSLSDLYNTDFPDQKWAVPNLVPEGLSFLAGRPKVGKSWLALQIASAVAHGGQVLGREVIKGRVLYIALEDNARRLKERALAQRIPPSDDLVIRFEWPALNVGGIEALESRLEMEDYRIVIIDTLARLAGSMDQSSNSETTEVLGQLQKLALDYEIAILLVDHHRKSAGFEADAIDDLLGGTGKAGVADGVIGLYRQRGRRDVSLKVTGRDVEDQDLLIEWEPLTCCWQLVGDANEIATTEQQDEVMTVLQDMEEATNTEIAEAVGKDRSNVHKVLMDLIKAGKVKRVKEDNVYTYSLMRQ